MMRNRVWERERPPLSEGLGVLVLSRSPSHRSAPVPVGVRRALGGLCSPSACSSGNTSRLVLRQLCKIKIVGGSVLLFVKNPCYNSRQELLWGKET